ncbi:hypothetical protein THUN1379_05230 [Paludibacterium sp. THUN1379]|uniref:2Fe-2S iron-sulfur cluster-binding protein n=1 Tax=Paludibacterium sp. THUN1379 TaxID=3112107 RepID=UPI00308BA111|nr:hypothetical protein THUN1379_05230 [Paludibacterium sp. THUN1379]
MPQLSFRTESGEILLDIFAQPGTLLLDVARANEVPLHWRCGQGTCGTCRVRVVHAHQPGMVSITPKERNVLVRHGCLPASALASLNVPDQADSWRLACHLPLDDRDWIVIVPSPV